MGAPGNAPDPAVVERLWEMSMRTSLSALDAVLAAARAAVPGRPGASLDAALDAAVVARRMDEAAAPFAALLKTCPDP